MSPGVQVVCRFSDAGDDDLATRSGSRRPKSAKARNRGRYAPWPCRRFSYGGLSGERAACMPVRGERWSDCAGRSMIAQEHLFFVRDAEIQNNESERDQQKRPPRAERKRRPAKQE
jgi:hypothetical protein